MKEIYSTPAESCRGHGPTGCGGVSYLLFPVSAGSIPVRPHMTLLEKYSEIRSGTRKCRRCGQTKSVDAYLSGMHKVCVECKCAELSRKRGVRGRPRKTVLEDPVETEPVTMVKPRPVFETVREPPRLTGRPPLLRIPKPDGLPPKWV